MLSSQRITQDNYGKTLVIRRAGYEDQGTYTCEVSNGVGTAQTYSIQLNVEGKHKLVDLIDKISHLNLFSSAESSYAKVVGASDTRLHRLTAERTLIAGAFGTRHACPAARPQHPLPPPRSHTEMHQ
ncbi:Neuroglian [Papilio machaon]|uniref:Neuroglian n=1 Tax=Papilio machaon TaxID=76193 RepID=A0A0N1IJ60_PAPMA|nr:Neuroglian [Papilio machaon]